METEPSVRVFARHGAFTYFGELHARWETASRRFSGLTVGSYYRLLPNLRVGAFFSRQYGLRHDEDWVKWPSGAWRWNETDTRGENFLIADATPRADLPFLPGRHWVGELRARLSHNFFNEQRTLRLRPGVTYFWMGDESPRMSFFGQFEMYLPLNYGVKTIYETWIYAGALYFFSPGFQLGGFAAARSTTWGNTAAFSAAENGDTYETTAKAAVLGLTAIFQFDI